MRVRIAALSPLEAASATSKRPAPKMTMDVTASVAIAITSTRILFIECVLTGYPAGPYYRRWIHGECRICPSHSATDCLSALALTDMRDAARLCAFRLRRQSGHAVRRNE